MINKKIVLDEWLINSLATQKDKIESVHFDSFKDYKDMFGIELLKYSCSILIKSYNICKNYELNIKKFKPLICMPLGCSKNIDKWDDGKWENLGQDISPPELLLYIQGTAIFENYLEGYTCPIKLPFKEIDSILAIFTSSRDEISIKNNWEFWSSIYMYYKGDF